MVSHEDKKQKPKTVNERETGRNIETKNTTDKKCYFVLFAKRSTP